MMIIEPPEGGWQGDEVLTAWNIEIEIPVRSGFWLMPLTPLLAEAFDKLDKA